TYALASNTVCALLGRIEQNLHSEVLRTVGPNVRNGRPTAQSMYREIQSPQHQFWGERKMISYNTMHNGWLKGQLANLAMKLADSDIQAEGSAGLLAAILKVIRCENLKNVQPFYGTCPLKDVRYIALNKSLEQLRTSLDRADVPQSSYRFKKTWKLYEYYSLFQIIDVFLRAGYVCVQQPKTHTLHHIRSEGIQEKSAFVFVKDGQKIEIHYEKDLPTSLYHAQSLNEHIYALGLHKKPDFRIDYYVQQQNEWVFQKCRVVDAKFRKLSNIKNEQRVTTAQRQLFSYWQIAHRDADRPVVSDVICLYANDGIDNTIEREQTIVYLKLFPDMENETDSGAVQLSSLLVD
ncbi:MAG: hypothetical protein ACRCWQ_09240, partial [Bacilli bacterium]